MISYKLYLESGPRQRKTMVHVLDLLGCVATGSTTSEALLATPNAIKAYLFFLYQHGELVEVDSPFSSQVVEHVLEGPWLGNGNPASGFTPDFDPITLKQRDCYLQRLTWLHAGILDLIHDLSTDVLIAKPPVKGRSIKHILTHLAEAEYAYLQVALRKTPGLHAAMQATMDGPEEVAGTLSGFWQIVTNRLRGMTVNDLEQQVPRGQVLWTSRRMFRRLLEHSWEHMQEIAHRLNG
jgi:predicted RNase H-like HicB family nuclease